MKQHNSPAAAPRARRKARHARARGLRTLQHQRLSVLTRLSIDTEAWFRALIAEWLHPDAARGGWSTKDQIHDEAIGWYLEQRRRARARAQGRRGRGPAEAAAREGGPAAAGEAAEDATFWIDSRLLERARRAAEQDGVRLAQLIDAALSSYVRQRMPEQLVAFRRRVQAQAWRMYRTLPTLRGGNAEARRSPPRPAEARAPARSSARRVGSGRPRSAPPLASTRRRGRE